MAIKVSGTEVVSDSRQLTNITGLDATTKTTLESGLTNVDAATLQGNDAEYFTDYTDTAVANLVASAPATLDTLNELAAALGDDPNFATTVSSNIGTKADKTTTISAGSGLTGGGDLSANRTISHADTSTQASLTALTGAAVVSDIDVDTYGHVTSLSTRNMTLADLGYTGATNANNYVHPSYAGDDFSVDTGPLTGATVVSDIDINVTTDAQGHVTDANGSVATRTLTLADLGYTGETNATADQTITAGSGLTGGGTGDVTLSHADTSSQASVNNSGATFIQDVTLDTYGHVTGLASATLSASTVGAVPLNTGTTWTSVGNNALSFRSNDVLETATSDQASLEVYQDTAGADAFMQFLVNGDYAAYFGLKGDINDFAVGGWSMGGNYYRVWHAGNDGSGSGLDADLLDGQQGSYYYPASNPNGYTSNVGDITGVTAGSGLTGGGTSGTVTVSHADTSSQGSINNSGATVIQDVTLDTYGHVTGLASKTLTAADVGAITGNQTITLSGDVSGSGTTSISVTVADDSHNHVISNVDGLQSALDDKTSIPVMFMFYYDYSSVVPFTDYTTGVASFSRYGNGVYAITPIGSPGEGIALADFTNAPGMSGPALIMPIHQVGNPITVVTAYYSAGIGYEYEDAAYTPIAGHLALM